MQVALNPRTDVLLRGKQGDISPHTQGGQRLEMGAEVRAMKLQAGAAGATRSRKEPPLHLRGSLALPTPSSWTPGPQS